MLEEALTGLVLGDLTVAALVGNRVHWDSFPRGLTGWPRVRLQLISAPEAYHFTGKSGLSRWTLQIDVWAETKSELVAATRALRLLLGGFRGVAGGVDFRAIFITGGSDMPAETIPGTDDQLHRHRLDLGINWKAEG